MKRNLKIRKTMSLLLVLAMLSALIVPYSAMAEESYESGIVVSQWNFNSTTDFVQKEYLTFEFTGETLKCETVANSGYYHLYFKNSSWGTVQLSSGNEYTVSFKAKTEGDNLDAVSVIQGVTEREKFSNITTDWQEYSVTFTPESEGEMYFKIYVNENAQAAAVYFDDVVITQTPQAPKIVSSTPENESNCGAVDKLSITFNNIMSDSALDTENYTLTGGDQIIEAVSNTEGNTYEIRLDKALSLNKEYTLGINVSDKYGQQLSETIVFTTSAKIMAENYFGSEDCTDWLHLGASNIDISIEGEALKCETKITGSWSNQRIYIKKGSYDNGTENVVYETGKEYLLTFKAKAGDNFNMFAVIQSEQVLSFVSGITSEWKTFSIPFTANSAGEVNFAIGSTDDSTLSATLYLDDICITTEPEKASLVSSVPVNGGNIGISDKITLTFSGDMGESALNPESYVLTGGTTKISNVTYSDGSYILEADGIFEPNKEYTLTINARDMYAQKVENNTVTFTAPAKVIAENHFETAEEKDWLYVQAGEGMTKGEADGIGQYTINGQFGHFYIKAGVLTENGTNKDITYEAGKEYTISFKLKDESENLGYIALFDASECYINTSGSGWKTYTKTYTPSKTNGSYMVFALKDSSKPTQICIDDLYITTNPDALSIISSNPSSGEEIEAADCVTVKFNNEMSADVTDISKYAINDNEIEAVTLLEDGSYKIKFKELLETAKSYTLSINEVSDIHGQTISTAISFSIMSDNRLHYDDTEFYLDYGKDTELLIENTMETGEISAVVKNIRNLTSDEVNMSLIIALYKDDRLVKTKIASADIMPGGNCDDLIAALTVPQDRSDGVYKIQAFLWNMNTMSPIDGKEAKKLNDYALTVLTVSADGAGDFISPALANASITDSGKENRYIININPGVYTDVNWFVKPYVTLRGTDREACILQGELPDEYAATEEGRQMIWDWSTINLKESCNLENLTITAKNMRYPVHNEGGGTNKNAVHRIKNCHIEHLGTQGATDYYLEYVNPQLPAEQLWQYIWQSTTAWGYGSASGMLNVYDDTTFKSNTSAWYVHNREEFEKPQINVLNNCHLSAGHKGDVVVQSLGSTTNDKVILNGCTFDGYYVRADDSPWIYSDTDNQYADHSDFKVIINNCGPIGYKDNSRGKALAIFSNNTNNNSGVEAKGEAADILLGSYTVKNGGGGIQGYLYGYYDISGILVGESSSKEVNNTIGRRLGDCTYANKKMTVTFDESNEVEIVFDKNYTDMANSAILSAINAEISEYGYAAEYSITANEYYPEFIDKELKLENGADKAIKRFSPVCYDENGKIRSMTSTDGNDKFAGIALENILPAESGRILTEGYLNAGQLGLSSMENGTNISAASDGSYVISDENPILSCSNDYGWAYFNAAK